MSNFRGAQERQLPQLVTHMPGPVFNIRDPQWGAKGDGATDDTAAIQAAIDAAEAAGGGSVYLSPGLYVISDTLTIDNIKVGLRGAGEMYGTSGWIGSSTDANLSGITRIKLADNSNCDMIDITPATSGDQQAECWIEGIRLYGNAANQSGAGPYYGIKLGGGAYILKAVIRNVIVSHVKGTGIYLDRREAQILDVFSGQNTVDGLQGTSNAVDCQIWNSLFGHNGRHGVYVNGGGTWRVYGMDCFTNTENGLYIVDSIGNDWINLHINSNGRHGIAIEAASGSYNRSQVFLNGGSNGNGTSANNTYDNVNLSNAVGTSLGNVRFIGFRFAWAENGVSNKPRHQLGDDRTSTAVCAAIGCTFETGATFSGTTAIDAKVYKEWFLVGNIDGAGQPLRGWIRGLGENSWEPDASLKQNGDLWYDPTAARWEYYDSNAGAVRSIAVENVTSQRVRGTVTSAAQAVTLGTIPAGAYVTAVHIHVTEAFNSDGSDFMTVGHAAAASHYATAVDVSTTGVKTVTLGAGAGYNASELIARGYYTNGGSEPTTGSAVVIVEYVNA